MIGEMNMLRMLQLQLYGKEGGSGGALIVAIQKTPSRL